MALQESGEMYLETIYILSKEQPFVRSLDVAESLGYSKPSVSRAVSLLRQDGYVEMDRIGHLTLTEKGLQHAMMIYDRHIVLTEALMKLGIEEAAAARDACKIEHDISQSTFEAIKQHLERYVPEQKAVCVQGRQEP